MKRIILTFAFCLLSPYVFANDEVPSYQEVLVELNRQLNLKDYQSAYQYADQNTYEYGGLPEFDLLSGFAAYGNEMYQEAVFAFERVVVERPNSFLARYYLALCYQKVNNLGAATNELTKLLNRPINTDQKEQAQSLLDRIDRQIINKRLSWSHSVTGGVSMDSNVNSGTSLDSYQFALIEQPVVLSDESKKINDLSYNIFYRAAYQHPFTQNQWLRADLSIGHINYLQHEQYRKTPMFAGLTYEYNTQYGLISTSVSTSPLLLVSGLLEEDAQEFNDGELSDNSNNANEPDLSSPNVLEDKLSRLENQINIALSKSTSSKTSYRASLGYSLIDNPLNETLNSVRIKATYAFTLKGKFVQTVMGHVYQETNNSPNTEVEIVNNDKNVIGLMYNVTLPVTEHILGNSFILYEHHEFQGFNELDQKKRADNILALSGQLMFNTSSDLKLKLFVNHHIKNSNIGVYEYNRTEIGATWQYEL